MTTNSGGYKCLCAACVSRMEAHDNRNARTSLWQVHQQGRPGHDPAPGARAKALNPGPRNDKRQPSQAAFFVPPFPKCSQNAPI